MFIPFGKNKMLILTATISADDLKEPQIENKAPLLL
jgi:hypothetical protein